ncbi:MAG: hypothetical protein K1X67_16610 [Fimbriimonadaceae bacterium]|nr:hypothetical protein [Fimbriimonadaceae bacterium]
MNVEAVTLQCTDPEALAEFYVAGFDLAPPRLISADHIGLSFGEFYVGLEKVPIRPYGGGAMTLWIMVGDTEETCSKLLALGADPIQAPDRESSPGEVIGIVADPEGNRIGLISRVASLE